MKTWFVLFILLGMTGFAQEQEKNLVVIQKGNYAVSIKIDSGVISNPQFAALAKIVVAKLQEKMNDDSTAIECNVFIIINQMVDKKTGELKKNLEVGVGIRNDFHPEYIYTVYVLPKPPFTEEDQMGNINRVLIQIRFPSCSLSK